MRNKKITLCLIGMLFFINIILVEAATKNQSTDKALKSDNRSIEIIWKKSAPITDPEARYVGFKPSTTILPKGYVHTEGGLPLPCDIIFMRDIEMTLRDGTKIYTDIFLPSGAGKVPAIISWGPYGKFGSGNQNLDTMPSEGVDKSQLSGLQKWEGCDPAYWCNQGYAIVNPDVRGAFMSEGNIYQWGAQDGKDGYDFIEWLAKQDWCNGKIGMAGNSWLAISQWFIAAEQPPHLAAIAPWEGLTDLLRDDVCKGGIPNTFFCEWIINHLYGNNYTEDAPSMLKKYPNTNEYWEDKIPKLENIKAPAYIVASYNSTAHTRGTFEAFRKISSDEKWLRVHNTSEWPDFYEKAHQEDLKKFMDHYLKGVKNDWLNTPKVRLSVIDPGGTDIVDRAEREFPLSRQKFKKLYLNNASNTLINDNLKKEGTVSYDCESQNPQVSFTMPINEEVEIVGYCKAKLWVEVKDSNDMDLYVYIRKLDKNGKMLSQQGVGQYSGPEGKLRVSRRKLDMKTSTESEPRLALEGNEYLSPGEIVPVEIGFWPTGLVFHEGEHLQFIISSKSVTSGMPMDGVQAGEPSMDGMPMGEAPASGPAKGGIPIGEPPEGGTSISSISMDPTSSKGTHIIHMGGKYDSHLLVPLIK